MVLESNGYGVGEKQLRFWRVTVMASEYDQELSINAPGAGE
jgi:hypothetical protein